MKRPRGIIEDVLIKVDKFYFPVDFIVIDIEPVHNVGSQIPVILGPPFLAMANALINYQTRVMKISFGNMTVELNIFDINEQPLDYDKVRPVCLIEEVTDEAISESSLEDPEIECSTPSGGDLDISKLLQQTKTMHEQAEAILDHILETQPDYWETTELSFPTPYSSAIESPKLISESKWVGPIHVWPRWPSVALGRKKDNELFQTCVQRGWQGCIHNYKLKAITRKDHFPPPFIDPMVAWSVGYSYFYVFDGYSGYNHVTLDPGKHENTTLTSVLGAFAYYHMPSRSCNAPTVKSLAEDYKLSTCGRQPFVTFSFCCHLIWFYLLGVCLYCVFQEIYLLFKFRGAFSYVTLNLCRPFGIVSRHIGDNVSF